MIGGAGGITSIGGFGLGKGSGVMTGAAIGGGGSSSSFLIISGILGSRIFGSGRVSFSSKARSSWSNEPVARLNQFGNNSGLELSAANMVSALSYACLIAAIPFGFLSGLKSRFNSFIRPSYEAATISIIPDANRIWPRSLFAFSRQSKASHNGPKSCFARSACLPGVKGRG